MYDAADLSPTPNKKALLAQTGLFKLTAKNSEQLLFSTYLPCRRVRLRRPEPSSLTVSRPPALPWSASATRSSPRWSAPSALLPSDPAPRPSRDLHSRCQRVIPEVAVVRVVDPARNNRGFLDGLEWNTCFGLCLATCTKTSIETLLRAVALL